MSGMIRTIEDMYAACAENNSRTAIMRHLAKADAPITAAGMTGSRNVMYGAVVYDQLNKESNLHAILPKTVWNLSGFRVSDADPVQKVTGVAEGATLPDTVKPNITELDGEPSFLVTTWDITDKMDFTSRHDDGLGDPAAYFREYFGKVHASGLNEMLCAEVIPGATNTTNAKGNDIESIDRMISNNSEANAFQTTGRGWYDVFEGQVSREAPSIFDSYVDHNSGVARPLSLTMMDNIIQNVQDAGASNNLVFVTGRDTQDSLKRLVGPQWKIDMSPVDVGITMDGITTSPGKDVDMRVNSYDGIPIFTTIDIPKDVKSRIYLLDLDHIEIRVGMPTVYLEADNKLALDSLKIKYAYLTVEQLYATRFNVHGKIRDLN